jgi:hypothetical protein
VAWCRQPSAASRRRGAPSRRRGTRRKRERLIDRCDHRVGDVVGFVRIQEAALRDLIHHLLRLGRNERRNGVVHHHVVDAVALRVGPDLAADRLVQVVDRAARFGLELAAREGLLSAKLTDEGEEFVLGLGPTGRIWAVEIQFPLLVFDLLLRLGDARAKLGLHRLQLHAVVGIQVRFVENPAEINRRDDRWGRGKAPAGDQAARERDESDAEDGAERGAAEETTGSR